MLTGDVLNAPSESRNPWWWTVLNNFIYDCAFNLLYENVYDKEPNTIQPFGLRVRSHFENSDINLDDIAPIVIPENPPWLNPKPTFIFELTQHKKSETNPLLIQQHFTGKLWKP
jgi:hypothetical protein